MNVAQENKLFAAAFSESLRFRSLARRMEKGACAELAITHAT